MHNRFAWKKKPRVKCKCGNWLTRAQEKIKRCYSCENEHKAGKGLGFSGGAIDPVAYEAGRPSWRTDI